jgi:O-antigen/teichoic acid export membrane protein
VASQVVGSGLWLVALPLVARHLGPTDFGHYILVSTTVALLALVTDGGLSTFGQSALSKAPTHERTLLARRLWQLRWATAVGAAAIFIAAATIAGGSTGIAYAVAFFGLPGLLLTAQAISHLNALPDLASAASVDFLQRASGFLALIGAVLAGLSFVGVIASVSASQIGVAIIGWFIATRRYGKPARGPAPSSNRSILRQSAPLALLPLLTTVLNRADTLILALLRPESEVGVYGAAYRGTEVLAGFAYIAGTVMLTLGARTSIPARVTARQSALSIVVGIASIVAGMLIGFTREILLLAGGKDFVAPISTILGHLSPTLGLGMLLVSFGLMGYRLVNLSLVIAWGRSDLVLRFFAAVIPLNLLLAAVLTTGFGLVGTALATLLTEAVAAVLSSRFARSLSGAPAPSPLLRKSLGIGLIVGFTGLGLVGLPVAWRAAAVAIVVLVCLSYTRWLREMTSSVRWLERAT